MELRARCPLATTLLLAALALPGCRDQPQPGPSAAAPDRPDFALPLAGGPTPPASLAPTVDALPPASSPLAVALAEGAERYRPIDQALAASEAFGPSPPDYVVRQTGTPVSVWRAENGGIRAVERLATGDRAYFYRALTEQPYLIAGPGAAYGYDRGELAAAYDGDGRPLGSTEASRRVVAAARLLDRGRALHRSIMQGERHPAHAADWRLTEAAIDAQRLRWRQSLGEQPDWRDWHDDQTGDRERRWSAERQQRLAYAAALRATPPQPRPQEASAPAMALAAAAATAAGAARAAEPPPPAERPKPATAPASTPAAPVATQRSARAPAVAKTAKARQDDRPRKRIASARAKRKSAQSRKRLRRQPSRPAAEQQTRIEQQARIEQPASTDQPAEAPKRKRPPKFLRDIGDFFDRTFGGDKVRMHRGGAPSTEE